MDFGPICPFDSSSHLQDFLNQICGAEMEVLLQASRPAVLRHDSFNLKTRRVRGYCGVCEIIHIDL